MNFLQYEHGKRYGHIHQGLSAPLDREYGFGYAQHSAAPKSGTSRGGISGRIQKQREGQAITKSSRVSQG